MKEQSKPEPTPGLIIDMSIFPEGYDVKKFLELVGKCGTIIYPAITKNKWEDILKGSLLEWEAYWQNIMKTHIEVISAGPSLHHKRVTLTVKIFVYRDIYPDIKTLLIREDIDFGVDHGEITSSDREELFQRVVRKMLFTGFVRVYEDHITEARNGGLKHNTSKGWSINPYES